MQEISFEKKCLRIRAFLETGVISDRYLPLDAILYYHQVRKQMGEQLISKSRESAVREYQGIILPLVVKKFEEKSMWFYMCSFAQWPDNTIEESSFKTKQGDWIRYMDHLDDSTKRIDVQRGRYKAAHIKMYYRLAEYVDWYCIGDPIKIASILRFCTNIGKNAGDGWGAVKKWEISDWPENWSIRGFNNKLMRNIPLKDQSGKGYIYGIRPSYWNPKHQFFCKMTE